MRWRLRRHRIWWTEVSSWREYETVVQLIMKVLQAWRIYSVERTNRKDIKEISVLETIKNVRCFVSHHIVVLAIEAESFRWYARAVCGESCLNKVCFCAENGAEMWSRKLQSRVVLVLSICLQNFWYWGLPHKLHMVCNFNCKWILPKGFGVKKRWWAQV